MNSLLQDLRFAVRIFRRSPAFALAALLSLVIGIGANTAIFSVVDALLLRPLPYQDAGRLVILWNRSPGLNIAEDWFSTAQYFDIKNGNHVFDEVAIAIGGGENLTGIGQPERIGAIHVSSNLLPMLGVHPLLGRMFLPQDDVKGTAGVALLNYGTWMRRFGGQASAVGRNLTLNGKLYQVVGVLPESFSLRREVLPTLGGAEDAEILLPLPLAPDAATVRGHEDYNILARLKPGVSVQQAQAEMDTLTARLRRDYPQVYPPNGGLTFGVVPLLQQVVGEVRRPLLMLLWSVVFVLLIACANVANLLLSHGLARQKEMAVRAALGAGRARLARQTLTESLLLAAGGGALGTLFALLALRLVHAIGTQHVPRLQEIAINGEVLLFTLLVSAIAGVLFGIGPALRMGQGDPGESLQEASRGSAGAGALWGRGNHLRRILVAGELALSLVLLIGAGLLIRSFSRLQKVPPGFDPRNVLTFELTMSGQRYGSPEVVLQTYRELMNRLQQLPGVAAAGATSALPLSQMYSWGPITVEGRPLAPGENFINADIRIIAGRYFEAMKIPLLRGRTFNDQDTRQNPRVIIVDDAMAQALWPGQDAIGKRIHNGGADVQAPWATVVGVVGRVKQYTLDSDSRIAFYLPHSQYPGRELNVVLRCDTPPAELTAAVRKSVHDLDPDLPIYNVRTMQARVDESLARQRFSMALMELFAGLALGLAILGTYGVISYLVNQGTREIGIRVALGATPRGILVMVLGRGMAIALLGISAGLAGALALTRLIRNLLFDVRPTDPATFALVAALLGLLSLVATFVPARRAARMDPLVSLRHE